MVRTLEGAPPLFTEDGLIGGGCEACGRKHFPKEEWCPWCGHQRIAEAALSTRGTLWSWTAVTSPPPGYDGEVPFGFGVVELADDGLRVITRLTEADPAKLRLGQGLAFRVVPLGEGHDTWAFAPR